MNSALTIDIISDVVCPWCYIGKRRIEGAMANWEAYIHADAPDRLVQLAIVHAEFESIHPFLDGNGRIGRLIIPLFLHTHGLLSRQNFYLSEYLEANRDEYGYDDWYDWNIAHWGTKWEVNIEDEITADDPNSVTVGFDTAWSPPIAFYQAMTDMGWRIKGFYWEPGMEFCGLFDDGVDEDYAIEGDSIWVVENIPFSIDECFNISGLMDEWEQMNDDEDDDEEDFEDEDEDKSGPDAGC